MACPLALVERIHASTGAVLGTVSEAAPLDLARVFDPGAESPVFCFRLKIPHAGWNGAAFFRTAGLWLENAEIPGHTLKWAFTASFAAPASGAYQSAPTDPGAASAPGAAWSITKPDSGDVTTGYCWLKLVKGSAEYPDTAYGGTGGALRIHALSEHD